MLVYAPINLFFLHVYMNLPIEYVTIPHGLCRNELETKVKVCKLYGL